MSSKPRIGRRWGSAKDLVLLGAQLFTTWAGLTIGLGGLRDLFRLGRLHLGMLAGVLVFTSVGLWYGWLAFKTLRTLVRGEDPSAG